jgi:REP-associated tyrosine transposase
MTEPHFQHLESAYQLHFYLCFKTHYLRPIFAGKDVQVAIATTVEDVCHRHGYHLLDTQFSPDHVRLLLSLKPEHTVSRAVQMLKGNLSRQFSLAYSGLLKSHRTRTLWAEGYFARSSGKADAETVRQYVSEQAAHHGYRGEWASALSYTNQRFHSPAFRFDHYVCILKYHLVLVTNFRTAIFDEQIAPSLFDYIVTIGNKRGFALERLSLMPDHIHLILEARPDISIANCALSLVNNTYSWMEKHYSGVLKQTNCWDVWQPSFYAGTVGEYSTAQIRRFS